MVNKDYKRTIQEEELFNNKKHVNKQKKQQ